MEKKSRLLTVLFGAMLLFLLQPDANAAMYVCVDAAGKEQYTNMNSSGSCRPLVSRSRVTRRPGSATVSDSLPSTFRQRSSRDPSAYDHYIRLVSRRYNVDPYLIKAVIKAESDFDCYALSKKGAQGLMQLMPATARELNVRNPFSPQENIDGGTRYLRNMLDIFDGNVSLSLAAYNAGPTLVKRIQRIPKIPETVNYVRKVRGYYKRYRGSIPQSQVRLAASNKK
jgi:soluble lytic murein transglycosylase-like protein